MIGDGSGCGFGLGIGPGIGNGIGVGMILPTAAVALMSAMILLMVSVGTFALHSFTAVTCAKRRLSASFLCCIIIKRLCYVTYATNPTTSLGI